MKRPVVKTTIVGGQPPGNERDLQTVPVGIEELIAMAAVDDQFEKKLLDDRESAVIASGVNLTPTEKMILAATDNSALENMIGSIGDRIPETDRRAFLRKSAAALLALVGGGVITTAAMAEGAPLAAGGVRVDRTTKGIRPDRPVQTRGISPDRPRPLRLLPSWPQLTISISPDKAIEKKAGIFENFLETVPCKDLKPVMIYFYAPGEDKKDKKISACIKFEKALAASKKFRKAALPFGKFRCAVSGPVLELAKKYKIKPPCILIFDGKGKQIHSITKFPKRGGKLADKLDAIRKASDKACGITPGRKPSPAPEAEGGARADRPKPKNRDKSTSPARGGVRSDRPKRK